MPGVRSLISIPAGHQLGARWHVVERYVGDVSTIVSVALAAVVVFFAVRRLRRARRSRTAGE